MSLPDQTPKLPKLPFLAGDALLLGVAWFIVYQSDGPLSTNAIIAVAVCVGLGAVLGAIPFFTDYARKQDEALDDRQRGLEALARTSTTAAEQISIAANGLNEITELLHRNLKHAEQLPQKLHEKIAEFNAQLDNTREDDREELEKEIAELRSSETERLQTIADRVHKAVGELTRLESSAQKHGAERAELVERANANVAKTVHDATLALNHAAGALARELAAAQTKALTEIEGRLTTATASAVSTIESAVAAAAAAASAHLAAPPPCLPATPPGQLVPTPATGTSEMAAPPKRPRKSRREEPAPVEPTEAKEAEPADGTTDPEIATAEPTSPPPTDQAPASAASEPPTAPADTAPIAKPAEPASPPPAVEPPAAVEPAKASSDTPAPSGSASAPVERPARKRRKPASDPAVDLTLELGGGEFSPASSDEPPVTTSEVIERVISSDGATRLIATAYIGIGNRLFIRGEGPGLSWEKGVPLQFVSIGKWRWETSEATAPVRLKLYKNDEIECSALGTLSLDPGHQQEVTARF